MRTDIPDAKSPFIACVRARANSAAPPRGTVRSIAVATSTSAVALLTLAGLTELTAEPFLIPPLRPQQQPTARSLMSMRQGRPREQKELGHR